MRVIELLTLSLVFKSFIILVISPRLMLMASLLRFICVCPITTRRGAELNFLLSVECSSQLHHALFSIYGFSSYIFLFIFTPSLSAAAVISASTKLF